MAFQMMFAIITVALISGAISDRAKFAGWLVFAFGWVTLVYFPVAHWVWGGGLSAPSSHALDFAGGTAVHINAGAARSAWRSSSAGASAGRARALKPHNVPFVALGAGLLWFGWFGFNAGSELTADGVDRASRSSTPRSPPPRRCSAGSSSSGSVTASRPWSAPRPVPSPAWSRSPRPVASSTPWAAVLLGLVAGAVCALAVSLKYRCGFDDSLDVVGVHFVGGWIGSLSIGLFANDAVNPASRRPARPDGLFFGGGADPARPPGAAQRLVTVCSFAIAFVLGWIIKKTMASGSPPRRRSRASTSPSTRRAATTCTRGGGGGGAFAMAGIGGPASAPAAAPASEQLPVSVEG